MSDVLFDDTKLKVDFHRPGYGDLIPKRAFVSIHYRGFLLDGTTFDSSYINNREVPGDKEDTMKNKFSQD